MESVPVRCPACRRDHTYSTPVYPCPCGAPTAPHVLRGAPVVPITHRTWNDDWVTVRCRVCGRRDQWPQPELCCPCGTVLRIPVLPVTETDDAPGPADDARPERPSHIPLPRTAPSPRPVFRPLPIRTARDAVDGAALYLRWLGYRDVVQPAQPTPARIDLRATGLIAQVDTAARPTALRDVECLWLNALSASVMSVYFSLAGYTQDAEARADGLGIPLFVMDPTGTPRPLNSPADELISTGA
ncbi:hypothetical protein [Streptomyces sp. NBC_01217]|uniref:hypothetical protein n=1 Tax=Streptomyces sp. NBC_01217 TaxID=2903779 RepID=UPI002E13B433|nr:hypothetical protein OG507_34235 [Streptomyces sp. NBC_01217]